MDILGTIKGFFGGGGGVATSTATTQKEGGAFSNSSAPAWLNGSTIAIAGVVARTLSSIATSNILQAELAMNSVTRGADNVAAVVAGANAMVDNNAKLAGQSMDTALAFAREAASSLTPAGTNRIYAIAGMIAAVALGFALFSRRKKR
jgi:hypothetical protein